MAFPSTVEFSNATLTSVTPTIKNRSLSGIETRTSIASQRFQINGSFSNLQGDQGRDLFAFLISGSITAFDLPLPNPLGNQSGTNYGNWAVVANSAAGNTTVSMQSSTIETGTIGKIGDLIRFDSTHDKVYMLTQDLNVSSFAGTIHLYPALTTGVTTSDNVTYRDVNMKVRLANDQIAEAISTGQFSNFDILFDEVVE